MRKLKMERQFIKWFIPITIAILLILGIAWYIAPVGVLNIHTQDVSMIRIFDGTTGQGVDVVDEADLEHIINNLNALRMKRGGLSLGRMGYRFRVTVVTRNNRQIEFIINSANDIRKDPFFYRIEDGEIDFDFIQALFTK